MKKASSYFQGLVTKSKKIFKKSDENQGEADGSNDNGFSSGEDDDLIVIGKHKGYGSMKSQFQDIDDLNGDKIIQDEQYVREFKKTEGKERESVKHAQPTDLDLIKKAFEPESDGEEDNAQEESKTESNTRLQLDDQRCLFSLKTYEDIDRELTEKIEQPILQQQEWQYIDFVLIVGFHHSVGSQVEFIYPPLQEDKEEKLTGEFLRLIPMIALPDGSHMTDSGYVYFLLRDTKNTYHCISCYRQIKADQIKTNDESVTRTFVQKAVVVMSKLPLYGELRAKLQPTTEAFFAQKDFKDCQILEDLFQSSNQFKKQSIKDISQFYAGLNLEQIFKLPNYGVLTLIKTLMLEGRIVVYSHIASRVSSFVYSLIALMPGCSFFKADNTEPVLQSLRFLKQFGFPLHIFASNSDDPDQKAHVIRHKGVAFHPMFPLPEVDKLDDENGFLIGTTNQLFLMFPKIRADIIVDLDKNMIYSPEIKGKSTLSEEQQLLQKVVKQHSNSEKKLFRNIQVSESIMAKKQEPKGKGDFATFNYKTADVEDINGLVDRDEALENELKTIVMNYLQKLFCQMALIKKTSQDFNEVFAPKITTAAEIGQQIQEQDIQRQNSPMDVEGEQTTHVDNTLLETQAREKNDITSAGLLNSDSLNKQGQHSEAQEEEKYNDQFDVINEQDQRIAETQKKQEKIKKGTNLQKFSQQIILQKKTESNSSADLSPTRQQLKKAVKDRDKALKEILNFDSRYNIKFLSLWTQTNNFRYWVKNHDTMLLAALSPQHPSEELVQVMIHYETGDYYKGGLKKGKRHSNGFYFERATKMTYNGGFENDMRHGQGTYCSERPGYSYIYDGYWHMGMKQGVGQEVTGQGKYNGEWVSDQRHGEGLSVDTENNMYEGMFLFGKKNGQGRLTRCNTSSDGNAKPEIVEGIWENDEIIAALPDPSKQQQ